MGGDGISDLPRDLDFRAHEPKIVGKSHQPRTLARREATRTHAFALVDEDLAAVLVIARRKRARDAVLERQAGP